MAFENLENIFNNREDRYPGWKHDISENINDDTVSDNLFNHTFGTNYTHEDIIQITPIQNEQSPSPLMAIAGIGNTGDTIVNGHSRGLIRVNYQGGLLQNNIDVNQKENYPYSSLIMEQSKPDLTLKNLGNGKYKLESLFDPTHGNTTPDREAFGQPNRISSDLQLHQSPHGPVGSLNIRATQGYGGRGGEPHVVHPIGFSSPNARKTGYDRDGLPLRAAGEDASRLLNYYLSADGVQFMLKENVTNVAVGDGITLAEPFRSLMLPPLPVPMTGFLNVYQQKFQEGFPSIPEFSVFNTTFPGFQGRSGRSNRKPGRNEYSRLVQLATPLVLKRQGDVDSIISANNPLDKLLFTQTQAKKKRYLGTAPWATKKEKTITGLKNVGRLAGNVGRAALAEAKKAANALVEKAKDQIGPFTELPITEQPAKRFLDLSGGGKRTNYIDEISSAEVKSGFGDSTDSTGNPVHPLEFDNKIDPGDFYVRIRDLRDDNYLYFRGFVTGITENVNPTWNPIHYVGRSEDVWTYSKAERDISFNLRLAPANLTEFTVMYQKMEKLTSLVYPAYYTDMGNITTRMQPPFTELYLAHIGSKAMGQFGYIKSLTYTVNEQGDWDAIDSLPRVIDVAISYQILHKKSPSITTEFYKLKAPYSDEWA